MTVKKSLLFFSVAAIGTGCTLMAPESGGIDWSKVPAKTVLLFYPGQSSYEWLRSDAHKNATTETRRGDACTSCHDDPEDIKGDGEKIVAGNALEPRPVKGKNPHVDLKVQAAYDDKNAYLRFQWKTQRNAPGIEYPYYRFDGKEWKQHGYPKLDQVVREGKQPGIYEDRLSLMLDDGKVPGFAQQGCWLTCHDGERDMPKLGSREDAQKYLKKADVRKYLPGSRTDPSDWRSIKSPEELAKLKAAGGFVDLIQWRAHRSNPLGVADDGYVLEYRNFDAGKSPFASNMDAKTKQPKVMYDVAKFGSKSVSTAQVPGKGNFLTMGQNAVPFDPNAGWKAGDMLPRYYLQTPEGSGADNKATGSWKDGVWTMVLTRPLALANGDDKALKPGGVYTVGFAVHDDNITTRGHFVSFPMTVGLGVKADIQAVKLP
jgi:hypothetical protein